MSLDHPFRPMSINCVTGYGFFIGIRHEFLAEGWECVADMAELGVIDAPDCLAGGGLQWFSEGPMQNVAYRGV